MLARDMSKFCYDIFPAIISCRVINLQFCLLLRALYHGGRKCRKLFFSGRDLKKRGALVIKEFSVVPHKWVVNGFLFWPNSGLNKLQKDSSSEPVAEEWTKSRCITKNFIQFVNEMLKIRF